jgi:hypothetical protein
MFHKLRKEQTMEVGRVQGMSVHAKYVASLLDSSGREAQSEGSVSTKSMQEFSFNLTKYPNHR